MEGEPSDRLPDELGVYRSESPDPFQVGIVVVPPKEQVGRLVVEHQRDVGGALCAADKGNPERPPLLPDQFQKGSEFERFGDVSKLVGVNRPTALSEDLGE